MLRKAQKIQSTHITGSTAQVFLGYTSAARRVSRAKRPVHLCPVAPVGDQASWLAGWRLCWSNIF